MVFYVFYFVMQFNSTAGKSRVDCSCCGTAEPKPMAVRVHRCPTCGIILNRDHNAAINILQRSTVGTAGSYAWGEMAQSGPSLNQEAQLIAAG